jgi:hypothetical protein
MDLVRRAGVETWAILMPMLMAVAGGAGAQSVSGTLGGTSASLHTPDLIAPAVLPYLACLYAARGQLLLRGSDGRPIGDAAKSHDCTAVRRNAEANALKLLEGKTIPDGISPELFVLEALSAMDRYVDSLPSAGDRRAVGDLPMVTGTPVTIEDDVKPAYAQYNACLGAKTSETPITAANVLGKFGDALRACAAARAEAVRDAEQALIAKGWDEAARKKAAENTFDQADQSWTAMGQRLHDALLERDMQAAKSGKPKPGTAAKLKRPR